MKIIMSRLLPILLLIWTIITKGTSLYHSDMPNILTHKKNIPTIRALEGSTAILSCGPRPTGHGQSQTTISWLRSDSLQILSVGYLVFTHDNRYSVNNNMDLNIKRLNSYDIGQYECQVVDRLNNVMIQHVVNLNVITYKEQELKEKDMLQKDAPVPLTGKIDDARGKTNREKDKTLNKLMEISALEIESSSTLKQENDYFSWAQIQLPIVSVLIMSTIIIILGIVTIIGKWRRGFGDTNTDNVSTRNQQIDTKQTPISESE